MGDSSSDGIGLHNIRDRAAAFDGTIEIHSGAKIGTEVVLNLPN